MRKLLLITTALVGITLAAPAAAAPVGVWVATAILGASAAGTIGFALVAGVVSMAISVGVSMIAMRMRGKPKQEAVRQELTRPTSLPSYRFVYGKTWAPGTPVAWRVQGRHLYICYLLNSRPSAGPFTVLFDKRVVEKEGDEFNFGPTGGAVGTNRPFGLSLPGGLASPAQIVTYWIGRGDQTTCPAAIVAETNGFFTASDAWRGRTVLWARLNCGRDEERQERWPASPPELNVDGNWSIVRDPRDGQDKFSRNQALIVLDALRTNPLRPYANSYLRIDSFEWSADVADQPIGVRAGGTIPRYQADGVLVFSDGAELEDQLQPLLEAGASRFSRIGGRLAMVPAVARDSVKTITDFTTGQPPDFIRWRSADELYTEAVARYPAPDRAYESAETPVHVVAGAQEADGGTPKRLTVDLDFVTDGRQAQRIAKIMAMRSRMQRGISAELFPDCFNLVSGSVATVQLGPPYGSWDGLYEVEMISPAAGIEDEDSITIRLPTVLREDSAAIYAWNVVAEEKTVAAGGPLPQLQGVLPPASVTAVTGTAAAETSGDTVVPGVTAAWPGSTSASTTGYLWEWQVRVPGGTWSAWRSGGAVDLSAADGVGVFTSTIQWPRIGDDYRFRVRTMGTWGQSAWVLSAPIIATGPSDDVDTPPAPSASPQGSSRINIAATQASDNRARKLLVYGNDVNSALTAVLLVSVDAGASATVNRSETGLTSGTTRFYFTRARDQWGNLSDFSDSGSATTP